MNRAGSVPGTIDELFLYHVTMIYEVALACLSGEFDSFMMECVISMIML